VREVCDLAVGIGFEGGVDCRCVVSLSVAWEVIVSADSTCTHQWEYIPLAPQSLTELKAEASHSAYCGCDLEK